MKREVSPISSGSPNIAPATPPSISQKAKIQSPVDKAKAVGQSPKSAKSSFESHSLTWNADGREALMQHLISEGLKTCGKAQLAEKVGQGIVVMPSVAEWLLILVVWGDEVQNPQRALDGSTWEHARQGCQGRTRRSAAVSLVGPTGFALYTVAKRNADQRRHRSGHDYKRYLRWREIRPPNL